MPNYQPWNIFGITVVKCERYLQKCIPKPLTYHSYYVHPIPTTFIATKFLIKVSLVIVFVHLNRHTCKMCDDWLNLQCGHYRFSDWVAMQVVFIGYRIWHEEIVDTALSNLKLYTGVSCRNLCALYFHELDNWNTSCVKFHIFHLIYTNISYRTPRRI
jgi:hypothetical protein